MKIQTSGAMPASSSAAVIFSTILFFRSSRTPAGASMNTIGIVLSSVEPAGLLHTRAQGLARRRRGVEDFGEASLTPPPQRGEAGVGGDLIEPGARRSPRLEPGKTAPRPQRDVLQDILGVGPGAQHPVAMHQ